MKIVFFGDSITEAGRDLFDETDLGAGYVKIAAGKLRLLYPDSEFTVLNRGVGGDRTEQLLARLQEDVLDEKPDVVVLQVGINDAWHRFLIGVEVTAEDFRSRYEALVKAIRESGAALILLQPYALKMGGMSRVRPYLSKFNAIIDEIAAREKLPVIRMDEIFTGVTQDIAPEQFSVDGVHPTHRGCRYIADQVIKELRKYVK